ncbi:hypothetical protein [Hymenobacter psoromatis]|uniref:hypothetical protein n=1 Tax=Hymenobacter psoromatis TaxID=1484116 RepID=UPI001CC01842|nr:hypothetical protein [Hymenobacter psoromatis]
MRILLLTLLSALATACCWPRLSSGPRGFWHPNRVDHHGDHQGRWRIYSDDANTQPYHARVLPLRPASGRWRYYAATGSLVWQERYRRHGLSDLIYYYPSGQVARRGQARVADEPGGLHFYWFGQWQSYL